MPSYSLSGKVVVWFLLIVCFSSFSSGSARAVICLEQNGKVELLHSNGHCLDEHLHGQQHKSPAATILRRSNCSTCDDFEISFQLYAPRNEPISTVINFIANPQLITGHRIQPLRFTSALSQSSSQPSTIDPSFTHLESIILLI
jgi:hypothetical protein